MQMNVLEARKLQNEFYDSRKEDIAKLLEKIYSKIKNAASNGFDKTSIEFDEIGCPASLKKAVLRDLHKNGFKTETTILECVIKW